MSDPIPGFAKKLYRVYHEKTQAPPWDDIPASEYERWIQVAAAGCVMALGSDHLTNALANARAETERLRAENATLDATVTMTAHQLAASAADNARLHEALELIADGPATGWIEIARSALEGKNA